VTPRTEAPPKPEPLPECKGCEECHRGPDHENELFVHYSNQHGGRWLCNRCFFKLRPDWPKPAAPQPIPARTLRIEMERVRYWLDQVKAFEKKCRKEGKNRTSAAGVEASMEDRDLDQAVECAVVEALGGEPNLKVHPGDDGKVDGVLPDGRTYDVKCTAVRAQWDGPRGFNDPDSADGRVVADLIIGALVFKSQERCEALGWLPREAKMKRIEGFSRPAYPREDLLPMEELQEEDVETKKKLEMFELAEKVLKYIEGNKSDPKRIQLAIDRYRKKRNEG